MKTQTSSDRTTESPEIDDPRDSTHSLEGVDLTLVRWMLSLTPEQRLEHLQDHARAMWEMRNAFRAT